MMQFIFAIVVATLFFVTGINSIPIERPLATDSVGNVIGIESDHDNGSINTHPIDQCATNFMALEKALINTRNNRFELIKTFYPARSVKPVYVKQVIYMFLGNEENDSTINESWIWSNAAFYLIQPPSVFQYTSLFCSYYTGKGHVYKETLSLYLPYGCLNKDVNWTSINTTCSALNPMLDILTQRLKLYAKYDPGHVVADESLATAACMKELERMEYDNAHAIFTFLSCVFGLPVLCTVILILIVRSVRHPIRLKIREKRNHRNLAAMALVGLTFSIYVLVLDLLAVKLVLHDEHEMGNHTHGHDYLNSYGLHFVYVTLGIDGFPFFAVFLFCLYLFVHSWICDKDLGLKYCFAVVFCPIFGPLFVNEEQTEAFKKECKIWLLLFCFISPLFCFASHVGYLIIAWVSNPQHAWSATLVTLFSILFFFFMYRQLYIIFEKLNFSILKKKDRSNCCSRTFCCLCYNFIKNKHGRLRKLKEFVLDDDSVTEPITKPENTRTNTDTDTETIIKLEDTHTDTNKDASRKTSLDFSFSAFFVSLLCGLFLIGIELYVAFALIELPFSTETSPTYVLSVAVILATLVACKVLIINTPTEEKILHILESGVSMKKFAEDIKIPDVTPPTPKDESPPPTSNNKQTTLPVEVHSNI